ncbi:urease accessory protein UreD [Thiofilum flexile]|uniref:urease accessory protein UreD n=1 Tax=Thiofilum flexile TaxID=125627 RepID=UPI00037D1066|nr:urease accessory protein UreD [Thiofilum flexile]
MSNNPPISGAGWEARLALTFTQQQHKTVLSQREQRGPLALQRPFYPEGGVCHGYILHPPGGVVGGDQLTIAVQVQPEAHALLTTPGATKFYRSAGLHAHQQQLFDINSGTLEWLPQESIYFPHTLSTISTDIHLQGNARFIGLEVHCLGRPASHERFDAGQVTISLRLHRDGKFLVMDKQRIHQLADLESSAGLRSNPVFATLIATPCNTETLEAVQNLCLNLADGLAGATLMREVLIVRYLGQHTATAHQLGRSIWALIRPQIIGKTATPPRIWST